jgi:hypothetical protein
MIRYSFTAEDPTTFTKPWSAELPMMKLNSPIIEYACNEGQLRDVRHFVWRQSTRKTLAGKVGYCTFSPVPISVKAARSSTIPVTLRCNYCVT